MTTLTAAELETKGAREMGTTTMKAIIQEGEGSADVLHLREIERPALTDDRVLVRVRAASVNALDWHSVHGSTLMRIAAKVMRSKSDPVRGVDVAGVVEAVGKNVTQFRPGDAVFGSAPACFAEYVTARPDRILLKPEGLSFEQAGSVGVAGQTALQGLRDIAQVKPGQRVLIHGAGGGVGTFAVQIAKALGAHVTAVTGATKVDIARSLGADEVIDYSKEDFTKRPERYDVVFDVAATRRLGALRKVVTPGGILVLVGADKRGGAAIFARIIGGLIRSRVFKQRVRFFVSHNDAKDMAFLRELLETGRLTPRIDRTYPLSEAVEAVRYVGSGQARAKVVLTVG
jgi:NADPH:quinone reductase-like Zn-dependent oxidoreductase